MGTQNHLDQEARLCRRFSPVIIKEIHPIPPWQQKSYMSRHHKMIDKLYMLFFLIVLGLEYISLCFPLFHHHRPQISGCQMARKSHIFGNFTAARLFCAG